MGLVLLCVQLMSRGREEYGWNLKHSHWPQHIHRPVEGAKQACTSIRAQKELSPHQVVGLGSSWLSELRTQIMVKREQEAVMGGEEKGRVLGPGICRSLAKRA